MLMHALAASCEDLRARTGNPPLGAVYIMEDQCRSKLDNRGGG